MSVALPTPHLALAAQPHHADAAWTHPLCAKCHNGTNDAPAGVLGPPPARRRQRVPQHPTPRRRPHARRTCWGARPTARPAPPARPAAPHPTTTTARTTHLLGCSAHRPPGAASASRSTPPHDDDRTHDAPAGVLGPPPARRRQRVPQHQPPQRARRAAHHKLEVPVGDSRGRQRPHLPHAHAEPPTHHACASLAAGARRIVLCPPGRVTHASVAQCVQSRATPQKKRNGGPQRRFEISARVGAVIPNF